MEEAEAVQMRGICATSEHSYLQMRQDSSQKRTVNSE